MFLYWTEAAKVKMNPEFRHLRVFMFEAKTSNRFNCSLQIRWIHFYMKVWGKRWFCDRTVVMVWSRLWVCDWEAKQLRMSDSPRLFGLQHLHTDIPELPHPTHSTSPRSPPVPFTSQPPPLFFNLLYTCLHPLGSHCRALARSTAQDLSYVWLCAILRPENT